MGPTKSRILYLRPGFRRDDPETWRVLSETNTGRYYDACAGSPMCRMPHPQAVPNFCRYGLPPDPVIVTRQLVRNRQNCRWESQEAPNFNVLVSSSEFEVVAVEVTGNVIRAFKNILGDGILVSPSLGLRFHSCLASFRWARSGPMVPVPCNSEGWSSHQKQSSSGLAPMETLGLIWKCLRQ